MKKTMLYHFAAILGYAGVGMMGMGIWAYVYTNAGLMAGWFCGVLVIGLFFFLNHFLGLVKQPGAWVDMGLGLGMVGFWRDTFLYGPSALVSSLPTILIAGLGAVCGGIVAGIMEKHVLDTGN